MMQPTIQVKPPKEDKIFDRERKHESDIDGVKVDISLVGCSDFKDADINQLTLSVPNLPAHTKLLGMLLYLPHWFVDLCRAYSLTARISSSTD